MDSPELFPNRPRELNATEFVQQRAVQIADLMSVVENADLPRGEVAQGPRTALQRMPRHMRRRAMAYNAKRFPRSRRRMAQEGMNDRRPRKKAPSRYHKRRASHLARVYCSRSRRPNGHWLETHVWHAKRFRMQDFYGFKVASKSYQRSFRPSYRDSMTHCTVHDESYTTCFRLDGPKIPMLQRLGVLCCEKVGLTFNSSIFRQGHVEGQITLYTPNCYPYDCLGTFRFIWASCQEKPTTNGILLIWAHPSVIGQLEKCFTDLFKLRQCTDDGVNQKNKNVVVYTSEEFETKLSILRHEFNRFKLTGPKSTSILNRILKCPDQNYVSEKFPEYSKMQTESWTYWRENLCKNMPGQIRPGSVLSLIVEDPRLHTDCKKSIPNCDPFQNVQNKFSAIHHDLASSPLWDALYTEKIQKIQISNAKLNEKRAELCKVGKTANLSFSHSDLVPVFLVCNGGGRLEGSCVGQGSGWDLVVPSRWSMPFWIALQYSTARVIGLDSCQKISFECQTFAYPDLWPDTQAGKVCMQNMHLQLTDKFGRRPTNRRTKFDKLKVKYPFQFAWHELLIGWTSANSSPDAPFYVLRDRQDLKLLSNIVCGKQQSIASENFWRKDALVKVRICSVGKGVPKQFSMICVPEHADCEAVLRMTLCESVTDQKRRKIEEISVKRCFEGQEFVEFSKKAQKTVNLENLFADKQQLKRSHRRLNDKLKKKRRKQNAKKVAQPASVCENSVNLPEHLPMDSTPQWKQCNVVDSCSRKIMGFVMQGDFSFSLGYGMGLGMCSMEAVKFLVENVPLVRVNKKLVRLALYRNSTSKCYRACSVHVDLT